jgi:hypothetical protein
VRTRLNRARARGRVQGRSSFRQLLAKDEHAQASFAEHLQRYLFTAATAAANDAATEPQPRGGQGGDGGDDELASAAGAGTISQGEEAAAAAAGGVRV